MSRSSVERKLSDVGTRLRRLRDELRVADEQHRQLADEADEARLRAVVADERLAERHQREAQRHADAMARHRGDLVREIARLETSQDALLDELMALGRP